MVVTWIADVTPLFDETTYEEKRSMIPEHRKEKADRLKYHEDKVLSVGAWLLWMKMKEQYQLTDEAVFNLSHSGKYALCSAVVRGDGSSGPLLGCDVEMIGKFRLGVARRFFCEREYEYLKNVADGEQQRKDFYRFWVLKESFVKATREGIKRDFSSFEIELDQPTGARLIKQPEAFAQTFYYQEYEVPNGDAKVAVCSTEATFEEVVWQSLTNV